jgi:hypothetical protein
MTQGELVPGLLAGAVVMGYGVCGLFFLRFWRATNDRLFAIFSAAFWVLGVQHLALALSKPMADWRTGLYTIRLFGFLLILGAIIDKNRSRTGARFAPGASEDPRPPVRP